MNRVVLIGNGFDLAHGLPTSYNKFINWYWDSLVDKLRLYYHSNFEDALCKFSIANADWGTYLSTQHLPISGKQLMEQIRNNGQFFKYEQCDYLRNISTSIETKGWVDIENEYYQILINLATANTPNMAKDLNAQLMFLQEKLVEYLKSLTLNKDLVNEAIKNIIYEPFQIRDISIQAQDKLDNHIEYWLSQDKKSWFGRLYNYSLDTTFLLNEILDYIKDRTISKIKKDVSEYNLERVHSFLLPNNILLLNFNYTQTLELYLYNNSNVAKINYIHGKLSNHKGIIFGYGDELDDRYNEIKKLNNNEYLRFFKSSKYLESDNYRQLLQFIESEPYQIYIMGHSCGNSDRTLLNTLFEHDNCVSIKPYYYEKGNGSDNYLDLIQNISRNFTDMKKMRDRVVNKTYCEPLPQIKQ